MEEKKPGQVDEAGLRDRTQDQEKDPLVVIVGPTAVGKTKMAIELALRLGGEVVTADSMQVYKGLDIGTDKPTAAERKGVPHHLIDIVEPDQRFNVAQYQKLAHETIQEVHRRGKLPILSGGTGLYVKAVLDEFLFPDEGADYALRAALQKEAKERGPEWLHQRLAEIDPLTARRLHPNDVRRVIRAIEVYETTGKPLSQHLETAGRSEPRYRTAMIGLTRPRPVLYQRINQRVDRQINSGLVEEVRRLMQQYGDLPVARQALGYKEIAAYLRGETSFERAVELLKRNTRRYAKRQFTWFRRDPRIVWFDLEKLAPFERAVDILEAFIRRELS